MKKIGMLMIVLMLVLVAIFCVNLNVYAGVADRIYIEGAALVPYGSSIDNSRTDKELRDLRLVINPQNSTGYVKHKGQTSYSTRIGYELVRRSWYTFSTEFQASGASFRWDAKPVTLYYISTGKVMGTYFLSQDKKVQFYSFNVKARFKPNKYLRPFAELGSGPMTVKSTDHSSVPAINWDVIQPNEQTGAAVNLAGGLGVLLFPSKWGDRAELVVSGGYIQGFASTLVGDMAYPYWSGGLKIKL